MGKTLAQKIIENHLVREECSSPEDAALRIDQTLTQDATGTMAYLALENMGIDRVRTELSVAYVDHNTLQCGFENPDDAQYIRTVAARYGIVYSPAGNGICHRLHLEHFGKPGKTLIGSDSHTPTCGALGMLAMGAGGMDVAVAMAGGAYHIPMPKMIRVNLSGRLQKGVSAKDLALELLRQISVKGGVGAVIEWAGEGIAALRVPERATICNMGAEVGATSTVFPSDEQTKHFLIEQGREEDYIPLRSDEDAVYDREILIDASSLKPLIACPHSPDNVRTVKEVSGTPVNQVCIGSCTNSSVRDMMSAAAILKGKRVAEGVELSVSPGSREVLEAMIASGALADMTAAGARILECACGPCIGMGFSPVSGGVSLRTFNRNFEGRSGTRDAKVYLCSPETAALSAVMGCIADPSELDEIACAVPQANSTMGNMVMPKPENEARRTEILRGPNIKPMPKWGRMEDSLEACLTLKAGDNITTDHIMPAGAKILPYRSNIPRMSDFCLTVCDADFPTKAKQAGQTVIAAGENWGQGSSREHAALVPRYLGVRAIVAKSFARIHKANLVNAGILPLVFADPADYDLLRQDDGIRIDGIKEGVQSGKLTVTDLKSGHAIETRCELDARQKQILLCGGLMNYMEEYGK